MKYKIKEGVVLPENFKIKVNTDDQTKALQEYLFFIGKCWGGVDLLIRKHVTYLNSPYIFVYDSVFKKVDSNCKDHFKEHKFQKIKFKDYFEEVSEPIIEITTKDQMYNYLVSRQYVPSIAEELSGIWAEHVNRAYNKGLNEREFVDKDKTDKDIIDMVFPKKERVQYVLGDFKMEDVDGDIWSNIRNRG